jgi:hypothetical protein
MKNYKIIKTGGIALMVMLVTFSNCKKVLDAEYRSELLPDYFSTPEGLEAGVTASYAI